MPRARPTCRETRAVRGRGSPPSFTLSTSETSAVAAALQGAVGCSNGNEVSVGQNGGIAYGNHTLVFVGFLGQVCAISDLVTFQESQLALGGYAIEGRASFANGQFWAAHADRLLEPAGRSIEAPTRG